MLLSLSRGAPPLLPSASRPDLRDPGVARHVAAGSIPAGGWTGPGHRDDIRACRSVADAWPLIDEAESTIARMADQMRHASRRDRERSQTSRRRATSRSSRSR